MVLPYLSIDITRKVFTNCEKARTIHSSSNAIPGLYASVNDVSHNENIPDYLSAAGIQSIAFEQVENVDVITPYGSMATFMVNLGVGLFWYHNILLGPRMQGPFGSTEAININGTLISPLTTWDSKITSLNAMLGGISNITQAYMMEDGTYDRFSMIVNREYQLKFPILNGLNIDFGFPSNEIPINILGYFPTCSNSTFY